MFGAIIGDIVGSRFEFDNHRNKNFTFFDEECFFTDDSVMTIAVAKAIHDYQKHGGDLHDLLVQDMHLIGKRYPHCGYGGMFHGWIVDDETEPYNSFGNGSAMRVSYAAEAASSLEEALDLAKASAAVTHNHPEGIKGAQAIAACSYLARTGKSIDEIRQYVHDNFYVIDFTLDEIRPYYDFNETCQDCVPQAIEAFLESTDFEDAIRNAISIGGDSDTIAAMTGAIAESYYGLTDELIASARAYLDDYLLAIIDEIERN